MRRYLRNRWIRLAIGLFMLGSAPLATFALLPSVMPALVPFIAIGTLLWVRTFWPAVFFLAAGIVQVRGDQ